MARITTTYFIEGDGVDPDACTEALRLSPTATRRRNDGKLRGRPRNEWRVSTGWLELDSIDASVVKLLEMLWPAKDRIVLYLSETNASSSLVTGIEIMDDRPDYCLSQATLAKAAQLFASYALDIYDYRRGQQFVQ